MERFLSDETLFLNEAYRAKICYYTNENGKKINPFQLISGGAYADCTRALHKIVQGISLSDINKMIEEIPVLSDVQIRYYETILKARAEYLSVLSAGLSAKGTDLT